MKLLRTCLMLVGLGVLLAIPSSAAADGQLFVVDGHAGSLVAKGKDRFELTIRGVRSDATWFADRPVRRAGSVPLRQVVRDWKKLGFVADPPNAAIELADGAVKADTMAVEVGRPRLDAKRHVLRVGVRRIDAAKGAPAGHAERVDRRLPRRFGRVSLFIDNAAWGARGVTVSVTNVSHTWVSMIDDVLISGRWDQAPMPGMILPPYEQASWTDGSMNSFLPLAGEIDLAPGSGGQITITWNWAGQPEVTGSLTNTGLNGLSARLDVLNAKTKSPTLLVTVADA